MKFIPKLMVAATLLACGQVMADNLLLQIQQQESGAAADFELVNAEKGAFAHQALSTEADENDLIVVGRDRRGRELFRTAIRNPGVLHAESFDPKTGEIEQVKKIKLPLSQFEVRVPDHANLNRVEILQPSASRNGFMAERSAFSFDRQTIDQALRKTESSLLKRQAFAGATSTMLLNTGPSANRMDIVLVGDGYTTAEQGKWAQVAKMIADGIMADPMFAAHRQGINIRRVDMPSAQSGVSEVDRGIQRNTVYGMTLGCFNTARLACVDYNRVHQVVDPITSPDGRDLIVAVANSTRYGGGGGPIATLTTDASAIELALHEIGHTAFKLADEYDYGTCDRSREPSEANATLQTNRSYIKWGSLIPGNVSVPTRAGSVSNGTVGLFSGGRYCESGMYRPTENSKMRSLGQPWHAVNENRIKTVFGQYYKPDAGNGEVRLTGTLSHSGGWNNHPQQVYRSANGGVFKLGLTGPSNADFELALYKWNGRAWAVVANATGPTSTENINYNGTAGDYYIEVKSYSGTGNYTLTYAFPK
ncbi:M64 family metallopeptidase [Chitinivorax sp. B]|uniref:M64 family metallopeptidase n=1 Tax=Chitinivorax sp. B TaxID=2502235 RepID=UPI0010F7074B|nr:M64 family metallopeptidase [Chitinivorax sp. B]